MDAYIPLAKISKKMYNINIVGHFSYKRGNVK